MKYKFPQFQVEIENPIIEINMNTIGDKAIDKLLSVDIVLSTPTAKFGVRAEDMPYSPTWEDSNVSDMVNNWLEKFSA
jgi:hypothetical protein